VQAISFRISSTGKSHQKFGVKIPTSNTESAEEAKIRLNNHFISGGKRSTCIIIKISCESTTCQLRVVSCTLNIVDMAFQINTKCTACSACLNECPTSAIIEGKDQYYIDSDVCDEHASCVAVCPVDAIEFLDRQKHKEYKRIIE